MTRSYRTQNGTSRRIDYVRPIDMRDCPREITIKVILLDKKDDNIHTQTDINVDVPIKNVLCKVSWVIGENNYFILDALHKVSLDQQFQNAARSPNLSDDGRRVTLERSQNGRVIRHVTYAK